MKNKLTSTVLAIALALSLSVPAFAADARTTCWAYGDELLRQLLCRYIGECGESANTDWASMLQSLLTRKPSTSAQPEQPAEPETPAQPETPTRPEPEQSTQPAPAEPETSVSSSVRAYEKEVVRLVNAERAKVGLAALTEDERLSDLARLKSQDMHDNGYFAHNSPTYGTPFQMMKSFGVTYRTAGENIAMGHATPEAVVSAWMNSSGHRANILNASYTSIGVGYVASGNYWTQVFIG